MTRYLFGKQSQPEEQGGFCDTASNRHYCNEGREEALNKSAVSAEFGGKSDFRDTDGQPIDPSALPSDSRCNTTILETDNQGYEFPSRYSPGR